MKPMKENRTNVKVFLREKYLKNNPQSVLISQGNKILREVKEELENYPFEQAILNLLINEMEGYFNI